MKWLDIGLNYCCFDIFHVRLIPFHIPVVQNDINWFWLFLLFSTFCHFHNWIVLGNMLWRHYRIAYIWSALTRFTIIWIFRASTYIAFGTHENNDSSSEKFTKNITSFNLIFLKLTPLDSKLFSEKYRLVEKKIFFWNICE